MVVAMAVPDSEVAPNGADKTLSRSWLDQPLSGFYCAVSWIAATVVYVGMVALLGGPTENDANESAYSTWAIAHGSFSCAYAPATSVTHSFYPAYQPGPRVAPLWPFISGLASFVLRIGHEVQFPSAHYLGTNCRTAYLSMYDWAEDVHALKPTTGLGYLSWFVLLAGVIALVRATRRGRSRWEAVAVLAVAACPMTWMPLLDEYHPQDIVTIGLILGASACFLRKSWLWTGILLGLAVSSQQFALLALVPLFFVAPPGPDRRRLVAAALLSFGAVALPVAIIAGRNGASAVLFGTGDASTYGGTVLWETGLHGLPLVFFSRVLPIALAAILGWWVHLRLGQRAIRPIPLISLVATSLSLRLVFEQGLFGYKFLALATMLIVLNVARGKISGALVAWILLVALAFNPVPAALAVNARFWGADAVSLFEWLCILLAFGVVGWFAAHRRISWLWIAFLVLALLAFAHWPPMTNSLRSPWPKWIWQVLLVGAGVVMASQPLVALFQNDGRIGKRPSRHWGSRVPLRFSRSP